jgi:hypothetical protein
MVIATSVSVVVWLSWLLGSVASATLRTPPRTPWAGLDVCAPARRALAPTSVETPAGPAAVTRKSRRLGSR